MGVTKLVARSTHREGIPIPRRELNDRSATRERGSLAVAGVYDPGVGRYTTRADLSDPSIRGGQRSDMLDCELDWMSEEPFALSGFSQMPAYADKPERLLRQGWLVEYDVPLPEDDDGRITRRDRQTR